jgi:hypothetical protein
MPSGYNNNDYFTTGNTAHYYRFIIRFPTDLIDILSGKIRLANVQRLIGPVGSRFHLATRRSTSMRSIRLWQATKLQEGQDAGLCIPYGKA